MSVSSSLPPSSQTISCRPPEVACPVGLSSKGALIDTAANTVNTFSVTLTEDTTVDTCMIDGADKDDCRKLCYLVEQWGLPSLTDVAFQVTQSAGSQPAKRWRAEKCASATHRQSIPLH